MRDYTQLTQEERSQIEALLKVGHRQSKIATVLKRHKSTISREVGCNRGLHGYRPKQAQGLALARRAESKDVSPLTDKTVGEQTSEALCLLLPCFSCGILLPHTSSTLHPKRPVETYLLQAPAGVCLPAGTTFCILCRQGDYPEQLEGPLFMG